MRELFLHVGPQKTGSTYLQAVLAANRAKFESAGLGFAPHWDAEGGGNHAFVPMLRSEGMDAVLDAVAKTPGAAVLVSTEGLARFLLQPSEAGGSALVAHDLFRTARRHFRVRLIYWARRQDFLAESFFFQGVKTWYSGPVASFPAQGYDHDRNLRQLEDVFGPENVTVFIYRDGAPNDLAGDFLRALGLARLVPDLDLDIDHGRRNVAMPRRKTLLLSHLRKSWKGRHGYVIVRAVAASGAVADDGMRFLLSPEERRDLVARYLDGNRALVARHAIADPGSFVELPDPDPAWKPPVPISAGEFAAVVRETAALLRAERGALGALAWRARLSAHFAWRAARPRAAVAARRRAGVMPAGPVERESGR